MNKVDNTVKPNKEVYIYDETTGYYRSRLPLRDENGELTRRNSRGKQIWASKNWREVVPFNCEEAVDRMRKLVKSQKHKFVVITVNRLIQREEYRRRQYDRDSFEKQVKDHKRVYNKELQYKTYLTRKQNTK